MSMSAKVKRDPNVRRVRIPKRGTGLAIKVMLLNLINQIEIEDNERGATISIDDGCLMIVFKDSAKNQGEGTE